MKLTQVLLQNRIPRLWLLYRVVFLSVFCPTQHIGSHFSGGTPSIDGFNDCSGAFPCSWEHRFE
jgi:hypothetical protein